MYDLLKLGDNKYQIRSDASGFQSMEGTVVGIGKHMVHKLGFNADEVEYALLEMHRKDHDAAHFGFGRTFIFSYERHPVRAVG